MYLIFFQVMWIPEMMYFPDQLTDQENNKEDLKLLYDIINKET